MIAGPSVHVLGLSDVEESVILLRDGNVNNAGIDRGYNFSMKNG